MLECPQEIRDRTLRMIRSAKDGDLIAINEMKYATSIVNFAASMHYWIIQKKQEGKNIPYHHTVLIMADNKSTKSWATKGCKRFLAGRALGQIQCALMINNPVGLDAAYINTKANVIADEVSRVKKRK
jgi:hypothetical protein